MKILFISMPSIHAIRWIENLQDSAHELFWFDVTNRGRIIISDEVKQFTGVLTRKRKPIKGEFTLSKHFPAIYSLFRSFIEVTENEALENIIRQVRPDIIHSFEMQTCSYPILHTMNRHPEIKWIYSCWGSDLFYYKDIPSHKLKIREVLKRVNLIHTDCRRDFEIAKELGFTGKHTGVIPGGTGYRISDFRHLRMPISQRRIILVKGYQHKFGRALNVVKALESISSQLHGYEVICFGTHQSVIDYIQQKTLPFKTFSRHELTHDGLMELMGKSHIYIGNSITDGIPNTLLEAMVMGAFPIQSNPGNVTSEIITDRQTGCLISDPDDVDKIADTIVAALSDFNLMHHASDANFKWADENLEYELNRKKVIKIYETP